MSGPEETGPGGGRDVLFILFLVFSDRRDRSWRRQRCFIYFISCFSLIEETGPGGGRDV